jgi:hypothetical protein
MTLRLKEEQWRRRVGEAKEWRRSGVKKTLESFEI